MDAGTTSTAAPEWRFGGRARLPKRKEKKMTLPFLYQLQNASYSSLSSTDFKVGVVDIDDAEPEREPARDATGRRAS